MSTAPNRVLPPRTVAALGGEDRVRTLSRALVALGRSDPMSAEIVAKATWPNDPAVVATLQRGSVSPMLSAAPFNQTALADIAAIIGPSSAFAGIIAAVTPLGWDRNAAIMVPTITTSPDGVAFLASAAPMPVKNFSFSGPTLNYRKSGFAIGLTRELVEHSNGETLIRQLMSETGSVGIEKLLLDESDDDGVRPAGLRHGIAAIAPAAADGFEPMKTDIANLAGLVSAVAVQLPNIIFIGTPDIVVKIKLAMPLFPFTLLSSAGLGAEATLMAIAANALVIVTDGDVRFSSSREAALHFEDTTPLPISTAGTPATILAAPVRSLFQTDSVAVRIVFGINYALRSSGAVAWTENITW